MKKDTMTANKSKLKSRKRIKPVYIRVCISAIILSFLFITSGCSELKESINILSGKESDGLKSEDAFVGTDTDGGNGESTQDNGEVFANTGEKAGTDGAEAVTDEGKQDPEKNKEEDSLYAALSSENGLGDGAIAGAAINIYTINDGRLMDIVHKHFNAVTLENELKMDCMFGYSNAVCPAGSLHEEELNGEMITVPTLDHSKPDAMLDRILEWNTAHPDRVIKVRGHVLVWHSMAPEWFFHEDYDASKDYVSKETMDRRLEWYIKSMLEYYTGESSRYNGLFYGWDVVNEAVSDASGTYRKDTEAGNDSLTDPVHTIKSSWWHVYKSNEFIINAFRYANKYASPEVDLYYNDYNECMESKMRGIIRLIQDVKDAPGTRIDGFGMQAHYCVNKPTPEQFDKAVRAYGGIVDKVMLTELDLRAEKETGDSEEEIRETYVEQAEYLKELYDVLKKARADGIKTGGITTWGVIDRNSWLQTFNPAGGGADGKIKQYPLLFDSNYEPKPALYSFMDN